jgi:hypothetical protein
MTIKASGDFFQPDTKVTVTLLTTTYVGYDNTAYTKGIRVVARVNNALDLIWLTYHVVVNDVPVARYTDSETAKACYNNITFDDCEPLETSVDTETIIELV